MTTARSVQIDLTATHFYHCITRCVRSSYLCGFDSETGKDYSHRKPLILERIKWLAGIFSIDICAFAIMSNHYHLVLHVDVSSAMMWKDDEVKARWAMIFPQDAKKFETQICSGLSIKQIEEKIRLWRERLMSISWYMRGLNEYIARLANKEDSLKGRFWESRFKSQALLDEGALLSAMAYVDLNPIRAKIVETLEDSEFTSIYERIKFFVKQDLNRSPKIDNTEQPDNLMKFDNGLSKNSRPKIDFNFSDYLNLVDETGRILREDKPGAIPEHLLPILSRLNLSQSGWIEMVKGLEKNFYYAVGHSHHLANFTCDKRLRAPHGMKSADECYLELAA